jgi:membrane-bound lytic murein transglycosylase B
MSEPAPPVDRPSRISALVKPAAIAAAVIAIVVAAFVVVRASGSGGSSSPAAVPRPVATSAAAPGRLTVSRDLAARINRAQAIIDDTGSPGAELAGAGRLQQLATRVLAGERVPMRRATLARLSKPAGAVMRTNLEAAAALSGLTVRRKRFPPWKIVQPPPARTLLHYFRAAQARFGVPWQDLAAIELIETDYGRIRGPSLAGAQGPMQFMPATWARYGSGSIDNQRDAILSAARYLAANGAPGDMADALYHYNNSTRYVHAVEDYARRIRADPRAYYGYYYWQVLFPHAGGTVILPAGYPRVRPVAP